MLKLKAKIFFSYEKEFFKIVSHKQPFSKYNILILRLNMLFGDSSILWIISSDIILLFIDNGLNSASF